MASSTAPITSSRGAADTTAGRIYFSTPSAHVRIPLTGPHLPPPPTSAHTILLGGIFIPRRKNISLGVKNMRRRNIYPGRSWVDQKFEKKPQSAQNCRTLPKIPYSIFLYIEPNCTLSLYVEPNYTLP